MFFTIHIIIILSWLLHRDQMRRHAIPNTRNLQLSGKSKKNRKAKPAFIKKFNDKDEDIPYVNKIKEKLVIGNYKPSSFYTTKKIVHFKQFHKFVDKMKL